MSLKKVDVAVIGGGTAGLAARRAAEKAGASTVLIDPGPLGTTCARSGCMPSKLLIAAAENAEHVRRAPLFGLQTSLAVDGVKVMERVRRERDRFVASVMRAYGPLEKDGKLIREKAVFTGPGRVQAGEHIVEARAFVVAAGAASSIPEPYQALGERVLTHESVFELKDLPKSLLVVGSGVIGLELGQAFHRLGTRVTILGRHGRIAVLKDPRVLEKGARIFSEELDLELDHELISVEHGGEGVLAVFRGKSGVRKESYERVLVAAGRRPSLKGLDPEKAGVILDDKGRVRVDPETFQAGTLPVFFAGDVNGLRPLLHEAGEQGRIAGANAARYPDIKRMPQKTYLNIVFTEPQMAQAGMTWESFDPEKDFVGESDYDKQGRSQVMAQNHGLARLYAEQISGRLKGAELLGPRMEHIAQLLCGFIERGMTVSEIRKFPFYHPVFEEGLLDALDELHARLKKTKESGAPAR